MSQSILYSLREVSGKTILSIDLGGFVTSENPEAIQLHLPTGPVTLPKGMYLNKDRIWDNGKYFFYVANKQLNRDYIFNKLLEYAERKIETRIAHLESMRDRLRKERKLIAA